MKNKGMGKFEVFVIIVLAIAVFSYIAYYFINNSDWQKVITMNKSTESFARVTSMNRNFFRNRKIVYLAETIEEGYMNTIKSPFSKGECSQSESKIIFHNDKDNDDYSVVFKCDDYLIEGYKIFDEDAEVNIYKVSEWYTEPTHEENEEEQTLYNCLDGQNYKYDDFYEEFYFISRINLDYGTNHESKSTVGGQCPLVEKKFYRTKELIKK